jgi:antitoxin (DNA-binding transcriptional repressor) of toxin-antitoxin stability system
MLHRYTLREAKARLSALLDSVAAGDEVEILRQGAGEGRFRIVLVEGGTRLRRPGALRGRLRIPDDFDREDPGLTAAFEE